MLGLYTITALWLCWGSGVLLSLWAFFSCSRVLNFAVPKVFYAAWIILCYMFNSFVRVFLAAPSPPNTLDVYVCLFFMISSCPPTTELQTWTTTTTTTFMVWFELQYRDRDRRFCVAADRTKWFGDLGIFFEPISPISSSALSATFLLYTGSYISTFLMCGATWATAAGL